MSSEGCQDHVLTHTHTHLDQPSPRHLAIRATSHLIIVEPDCLHECMSLPTDVDLHQQNFSHQSQYDKLLLFRFVRHARVDVLPLLNIWIVKVLPFYPPSLFSQVPFSKSFYTLEIHSR